MYKIILQVKHLATNTYQLIDFIIKLLQKMAKELFWDISHCHTLPDDLPISTCRALLGVLTQSTERGFWREADDLPVFLYSERKRWLVRAYKIST